MLVASDRRATGKIYNVTDSGSFTLAEIVAVIQRHLGITTAVPSLPLALLVESGKLADATAKILRIKLPLSSDQVQKLSVSTRYSADRIKRELNFLPEVGLYEGIALAVADCLSESRVD